MNLLIGSERARSERYRKTLVNSVWTSRSSLGLNVPYGRSPESGTPRFSRLQLPDGTPLMSLSLAVQWELNNGE